jgi:fluoroacetyl-CoA thioesterase
MRYVVTDLDTAEAMGSGDVPVLATPRLIEWMEASTVGAAAAFVEPGMTTVGAAIRVDHPCSTPVGGSVDVTATAPAAAVGRRLTFGVQAIDGSGALEAEGQVDRVLVDRALPRRCFRR